MFELLSETASRTNKEISRFIWISHIVHMTIWTAIVAGTVWYGVPLGWTIVAAFAGVCFVLGRVVMHYGRTISGGLGQAFVGVHEELNDIKRRLPP